MNAINAPTFGDNDAAKIGKIAPQVKWLMLSETQITDAALDNIVGCENLEKIRGTAFDSDLSNQTRHVSTN